MVLQTTNTGLSPQDAYNAIRSNAGAVKVQAQGAAAALQGGPVTSDFIYQLLDRLGQIVSALNAWKAVVGLDAYATAQGYTGTLSSDCATVVSSAQTCIAWVVANFPASGGFLQAYSLNADGSRTPRSFTSAQTGGLQTDLTAFIATIG